MYHPLITIVTPSFNRADMIETAIQSVLEQHYPAFEHLIIDGGSTDGTLELLKKYPHLKVISEPDQGMYDAINKGIDKASGELIAVLNSDDRYATGAFQEVVKIMTANPEVDVVWGSADMIEMTPGEEKVKKLLFPPQEEKEIIPFLLSEIPIFNACYFRKQVFERCGKLMPQIKIAGDREFMLRAALDGCKFYTTDAILYHYYAHDDSMTYGNDPEIFEKWNKEHCQIAEYYLETPDITDKARGAYRQMHTNSNLSLVKIASTRGDFAGAASLALHGWQINPKWLVVFLKRGVDILFNPRRKI
jgi:glycosyltransferase involved in cell wall biosynthesis